MTIRAQLRILTLIALIIMMAVSVFTAVNLNRLRSQFSGYQSWQAAAGALTEFKASALAVARADPILPETAGRLSAADRRIHELEKLVVSHLAPSPQRDKIGKLFAVWRDYLKGFRGAVKIAADSPEDALNIPDALYKLKLAPMIEALDAQVAALQRREGESRAAIDATVSGILWIVLVPMVAGGALVLIFQLAFSRRLRRRLAAISEAGARLSNGDLGSRLPGPFGDEIGEMSQVINGFVERFESVVGDVQESAALTRRSTGQVGTMSDSVAANAQSQSDRMVQVGSAVEEMAATAREMAKNATSAAEAASQSHERVRHGNRVGGETVSALGRIDTVVQASVLSLQELDTSIVLIDRVSAMIRDIADQTNLLALNAAIEAARAGDHGRGFAVVAEEVRQLSQRTAASTAEISSIVHKIQDRTTEAVTAMGSVRDEVGEGVRHGEQMSGVLAEIDRSVQLVTDMMQQIAAATEEQSQVARDIGANIETVAEISVATASDMASTRDAVGELAQCAERLHQAVDRFRAA